MDNPKLRDVESRKKGKMRKEWGKEQEKVPKYIRANVQTLREESIIDYTECGKVAWN